MTKVDLIYIVHVLVEESKSNKEEVVKKIEEIKNAAKKIIECHNLVEKDKSYAVNKNENKGCRIEKEGDSYIILLKNIKPENLELSEYSITEIIFREIDNPENDNSGCHAIYRSWLDESQDGKIILSMFVQGGKKTFSYVIKFSVHHFLFYKFYHKIVCEKEKIIRYGDKLEKYDEELGNVQLNEKLREGIVNEIVDILKNVGKLKTSMNYNYLFIRNKHLFNMNMYANKLPKQICNTNCKAKINNLTDFINICKNSRLGECELWTRTADILYDRARDTMDVVIAKINYKMQEETKKLTEASTTLQESIKDLLYHSNLMSTAGVIISFFIVFAYTINIWKSLLLKNFENAGIFKLIIPLSVAFDVLVFMQIIKHVLSKSWKKVIVENWKEIAIFIVLTATVILYFRHYLAKFLFSL